MMWRKVFWAMVVVVFVAVAVSPAVAQVPLGLWTAQYYANANLSGALSAVQNENSPNHDWGWGSPMAILPVDNFSVRWTATQTLNAGVYQLTVRADDGVRVYIDGFAYINEWHSATGRTYSTTVPLSAGTHTFVVEYYEALEIAYLSYDFAFVGVVVATATPMPPPISGAYITVTGAYKLNVRNMPTAYGSTILTKINRYESYPIVGRNNETTWWQVNVNGVIGWLNARYVSATNAVNIPVTWNPAPPPTVVPPPSINCSSAPPPRLIVGRSGRVLPGLPNNLRAQPGTGTALVGQIPAGGIFTVLGAPTCASGFYYWLVSYNGVSGYTPEGGSGQYWLEPI